MTELAAIPWPDAPRAVRERGPAARRPLPSLTFLVAVAVVLMFSGGWIIFVIGPAGDPAAGTLVMSLHAPAYLGALGLAAAKWRRALQAAASTPLLWALLALVAGSVLWSVNPAVTERRVAALLMTTLAGVALACSFDWDELSEVFAWSFAGLILLSLLLGAALPSWGRMTAEFPRRLEGPVARQERARRQHDQGLLPADRRGGAEPAALVAVGGIRRGSPCC